MFRPSTAFSITKLRKKAYLNCNRYFQSFLTNKKDKDYRSRISLKAGTNTNQDKVSSIHLINLKNNHDKIKESQENPIIYNEKIDLKRKTSGRINSCSLMNILERQNSHSLTNHKLYSRYTSRLIKENEIINKNQNYNNILKGIGKKTFSKLAINLIDSKEIKGTLGTLGSTETLRSIRNIGANGSKGSKGSNEFGHLIKRKRNSMIINYPETERSNTILIKDFPNFQVRMNSQKMEERLLKNYNSCRRFNFIKFNQMNNNIISQRKHFQSNQFGKLTHSSIYDSTQKQHNPFSFDKISPIIITQNPITRMPSMRNLPLICTIPTLNALCILKKKRINKF